MPADDGSPRATAKHRRVAETSWLADTFDQHLHPLYGYCRFLLRDPADAANAVEHTFLVAAVRGRDLYDPGLTLAWLLAVARNECLRLIDAGQAERVLSKAPADIERVQASDGGPSLVLMRAAIRDLAPAEREVTGLLWHGLDLPEIAVVLAIPRRRAVALFAQGRDRVEESVIARFQEDDRPAVRLTLTPAALLGGSATEETRRFAARIARDIRDRVLDSVADDAAPSAAAEAAVRRAGPFLANGFPQPLRGVAGRKRRRTVFLAAGGAVAAVAAAAIAAGAIAAVGGGSGSTTTGAEPTRGAGIVVPPAVSVSGSAPASVSPTASPVSSASASASPSASASSSSSASPSVTSSSAAPTSAAASPPASTGSLQASPGNVIVGPGVPGSLTLTAAGGGVSWSVSSSSSDLSLSQASGTLQAGQSVTIEITTSGMTYAGATLTVAGGGKTQQVTVNGG